VPQYAELAPRVTALDVLLAQLLQKVKAEQIFVANAAHEVRTPLAVISAQAHVLAKGRTEEERSEAQRSMNAAISRASHVVQQLLVLARVERAHAATPSEPINVSQLVREEIGSFVPTAMSRGMDISLEGPETLIACLDVHALQSALQNLIDNAIRYGCDNGRIVVELSVTSSTRDLVVLAVSDDGPGIPTSDHSKVFERFYRGRQRDIPGAGLGLTIVKQAVARMGGMVQIMYGLAGRGCRFEIHVPVGRERS
jgi:signal transduction histidine kinase